MSRRGGVCICNVVIDIKLNTRSHISDQGQGHSRTMKTFPVRDQIYSSGEREIQLKLHLAYKCTIYL